MSVLKVWTVSPAVSFIVDANADGTRKAVHSPARGEESH